MTDDRASFVSAIADSHVWHLLQVQTLKERAAVARLTALGLKAYSPLARTKRKPSRRVKSRRLQQIIDERAAYPGYVFIGFDAGEAQPWKDILGVTVIRGVYARNSEPMRIRPSEIGAVFEMEAAGLYDESGAVRDRPMPKFEIGDDVEILQTAWRGLHGRVTAMSADGERARVEFDGSALPYVDVSVFGLKAS